MPKAAPPDTTMDKKREQEVRRLASWRKDAWLKLGYLNDWADFLAKTQIDVHVASGMLEAGAGQEQVIRILAGYGPLGVDPLYDWDTHDALMDGKSAPEAEQVEQSDEDEAVEVEAGETAVGAD